MVEFNSNPNQRKITINKEKTDDKAIDNYYAKINLIALKKAMSSLSPSTAILWLYFSKNMDKHCFYLSKVDFLNWANIKSTTYHKAFKELKEKGYLVAIDKEKSDPTNYNFYEIPKEENKMNIISINNWENTIENELENKLNENTIEDEIEKKKDLFYF